MSEILHGDCLEVMRTFPDNHFTGVVTDPPYGLHFMGRDWDSFAHGKRKVADFTKGAASINEAMDAARYDERRNDAFQSFITQFGIEALRIVKPGGHILMFGAPRRYHRQACGLEDAGWEIRDSLMWVFGSGFPKSHNHFGPEGYGTALKPAYEPIIMAMKPLDGTFKQNYEKWGVGGINVDATRIPTNGEKIVCERSRVEKQDGWSRPYQRDLEYTKQRSRESNEATNTKGRWPSNLILEESAAEQLDRQCAKYGETSRFFYVPKCSSSERNEGLEGLEAGVGALRDNGRGKVSTNTHPTIKPIALMRYLIKLVCPPTNALVLDPFAGSGSTIVAANSLGIEAIGIEKNDEYIEIARARLLNEKKKDKQMDLF